MTSNLRLGLPASARPTIPVHAALAALAALALTLALLGAARFSPRSEDRDAPPPLPPPATPGPQPGTGVPDAGLVFAGRVAVPHEPPPTF